MSRGLGSVFAVVVRCVPSVWEKNRVVSNRQSSPIFSSEATKRSGCPLLDRAEKVALTSTGTSHSARLGAPATFATLHKHHLTAKQLGLRYSLLSIGSRQGTIQFTHRSQAYETFRSSTGAPQQTTLAQPEQNFATSIRHFGIPSSLSSSEEHCNRPRLFSVASQWPDSRPAAKTAWRQRGCQLTQTSTSVMTSSRTCRAISTACMASSKYSSR